MRYSQSSIILIICWLQTVTLSANSYELGGVSETLIGQIETVTASREHTLLDIARAHGFGLQDITLINPDIDWWLPEDGAIVRLPSRFILPNVSRKGIVLNIPEMRLYFFPATKKGEPQKVFTYPLGIGREGWETPYEKTRIIAKKKYPDWTPPESIRQEHEAAGDPLPPIVKAGPDNPLGDYALRLGLPAYLIHGTNKPWGIGMRVSHGCIRLYPEDIAELFDKVKVGTPVNIINHPYKVGEADGVLYLEAHPPLKSANKDENGELESAEPDTRDEFNAVVKMIVSLTKDKDRYEVDWDKAKRVSQEALGIPMAIGMHIPAQTHVEHHTTTTDLDGEQGGH